VLLKKILPSVLAVLCFHGSAFSFTIINQTDSEKVLQLQEAYRPESDQPGNRSFPEPLREESHEITIPAHSKATIDLTEPCPVLLVGVVTTEGGFILSTTNTMTTCYEPYGYKGSDETLLTDEWGIVIHKPLEIPKHVPFSNVTEQFRKAYTAQRSIEQGYGIKCLHPKLLEQVTSLEELPEELR
jgi:hypothetical protein